MKVGARNQLKARVTAIKRGDVMAQIKFVIPAASEMGSVITVESLDELGISDRAEVELTEQGILVKPALGLATTAAQAARVSQVAEAWGPQRRSKDWKLRLHDASRGIRGLFRRDNG